MTQIKLRRDTSANFTSKNPILGVGEPAYETDTKKLKIGDGTTAYTQLEYFSAGGGGSTNISATLPLKIVDGVISLEVDGQTIQIVDGKLHANLDELGNEVNTLAGRVTAAEADISTKQDILTPIQPLTIQNKIISNLVGMEYTGDGTGVYGAYSLESSDGVFASNNLGNNADFGSSWSATSIPCYIDIPYTFGQIVKVPSGSYGYTWNKSIGKLLSDGTFIPICTFYPSEITISDTLKSFTQFRAEWKTKGTERTSGSGFSVANGQAGCSYIQFIDNGSTIRCLAYSGNGNAAPSSSVNYTITNNTDIQRLREIQVVRIFPNRQNYGVSSNPYPVDRFGLYDGATTLDTLGNFNNLGENLFDLSSQVARNYLEVQVDGTTITTNSSGQLQANIPSNLTTQGNTFNGANQLVKLDNSGKLPAVDGSNLTNLPGGGSAPANMVTTDTEQTISGNKTFKYIGINDLYGGKTRFGNGQSKIEMAYDGQIHLDSATILADQSQNWRVGRYNKAGLIYSASALKRVGNGPTFNEYDILDSSNLGSYVDGTTITYANNKLSAASSGGGLEVKRASSADFNSAELLETGLYYISGGYSPQNGPTPYAVSAMLITMKTYVASDNQNIQQTWIGCEDLVANQIYTRYSSRNGTMGSWTRVDSNKIASSSALGSIKVGEGLTISSDGTLSASGGSAPTNMVTTDTAQTISGDKELTGITTISNDIKFTIGKKITTPDGEWLMQLGPGSIGIGTSMKPLKTYDGSNYYLHNKSIIAGDGIRITEPNSSEIEISSNKETIMGYIMPDYDNGIAIGRADKYEALVDGYYVGKASVASGTNSTARVTAELYNNSGTLVGSFTNSGYDNASGDTKYSTIIFPVPKGYKITVTGILGSLITSNFYPMKGVN